MDGLRARNALMISAIKGREWSKRQSSGSSTGHRRVRLRWHRRSPAAKPALPVAPLPVQPVSPQSETAESSEIHHRAVDLPVEEPPPADAVPSGVHDAPDTHDGPTENAPDPHATILDEAEQDVSEDHPPESDELEAPEPEVLDEPRPHWTPPDHSDHWHNYEAEYEQEPRFETRALENRPAMALEPEEPAAGGWRIPDGESLTETAPPEFFSRAAT